MLISLFCHLLNVLFIYLNDLNTVKAKNKYYINVDFATETNPLLLIRCFCHLVFFKDLNVFKCLEKIISIISSSVFLFIYLDLIYILHIFIKFIHLLNSII